MCDLNHSSISLALIRSPTTKAGMGLVVTLQTMQQLANHLSDPLSNEKGLVIGV